MARFGTPDRRVEHSKALAAFGVTVPTSPNATVYRTVRAGNNYTIFTIGYERRDGDDLIAALREAGVEHLADIRDKPVSRKPDFRSNALKEFCEQAGIEYASWSMLGSTENQRDRLRETGNLSHFHRVFRSHAERLLQKPLDELAKLAKKKMVALLCYERSHDDCHRSVVADLLADRLGATVTAIL